MCFQNNKSWLTCVCPVIETTYYTIKNASLISPYTKNKLDSGLVYEALNGFKTISTCKTNQRKQIIRSNLQKAYEHFGSKITIVIIIILKLKFWDDIALLFTSYFRQDRAVAALK